jgi:hypothetical protein
MKGHNMSIDEMALISRLGEVEALSDEAFEQARTVLHAAIALESAPPVIESAYHPKRRWRTMVVRGEVAAGAAAAVAAVALIATSPGQSPKSPTTSNRVTSSPLVRLADYVNASAAAPTGDAALVARTTTTGGSSVTVYDLYADNGQYFFSQTERGLAGQVSSQHNLAGGLFAREVAAAKLAATGNVQTAAQDMADAPDPSHVISPTETSNSAAIAAKEAATGHLQAGSLFDNWVWEDSQDAILAGSGNPQVRAGVLRILATLPDVTVTPGISGGQSTLVLTAGAAELGDGYVERLTINATTGIPVSFTGGAPGLNSATTVSYQTSRATLSDIAAGKF